VWAMSFLEQFFLFGVWAAERWGWGGRGTGGSLAFVRLVDSEASLGEKILFLFGRGVVCEDGGVCGWSGRGVSRRRHVRGDFGVWVGVGIGHGGVIVELVLEIFGWDGASFDLWVVWFVVRDGGGWDNFVRFRRILGQILSFFVAGCREVVIDLGVSLRSVGGFLVSSSGGRFIRFRHGRFVKKFNY